jgi:hypothetical protein
MPSQEEIDTLLQMGFTPYQVDEAFKKHSTLEAAANFLMDSPVPPSHTSGAAGTDHDSAVEETWVEHRGRLEATSQGAFRFF